ncbi:hypothetical protein [Winogradskyella sp.]|uniref:hypothetical protein n=1 Tax=Winogradskyella sp. TaxID=1883156 RepID=UPI0026229F8D|nr:hypothetical protein [Winogradskyella sp.]
MNIKIHVLVLCFVILFVATGCEPDDSIYESKPRTELNDESEGTTSDPETETEDPDSEPNSGG